MKDDTNKKHYIYVEVPASVKKKALKQAKKEDLSFRQWVLKAVKESLGRQA